MITQPTKIDLPILSALGDPKVIQAAQLLGKLLFDTPDYKSYQMALKEVNNDPNVHRLSLAIREHETALQWGKGDRLEHQAALTTLEAELEALPSVHAYHQAEKAAAQLFHAVDEVISQAAGIPFAPNAKRSGCGCGG